MFSGIIECVGEIVSIQARGNGCNISIKSDLVVAPQHQAGVGHDNRSEVGLGDSIAVMGACLTVETVSPPHTFSVAAGAETLACTTLGSLRPGNLVHLERSLRLGSPLDGHLVSGHVDGVGTVRSNVTEKETVVMWVEAPEELAHYIASKGSICIDGVSLTVNDVDQTRFRVNLIPFTANHTGLGRLRTGDTVNLEVDIIARYLERLLTRTASRTPAQQSDTLVQNLSRERLIDLGFFHSSGK